MKLTKKQAGTLGGLKAAQSLGEAGRERRASNAGQACLEKHGKAHFYQMSWKAAEARRRKKGEAANQS